MVSAFLVFELVDQRIIFVLEDAIERAIAVLQPQINQSHEEEQLDLIASFADHLSAFDLSNATLKASKAVTRLVDFLSSSYTSLRNNADLLARHESRFALLDPQIQHFAASLH